MKILDGSLVSKSILSNVKDRIETHTKNSQRVLPKPSMCIVLVGDNPASQSYVKSKTKACQSAGIEYNILNLSEDITAFELVEEIKKLNKSSYDGFIVQLPLPPHIKSDSIINEISAYKDIDGFHPINFGKMAMGQKSMRPATAYGILKLIEYYNIETCGKHIVVVGRSNIVGKPVSIMLGNDFNIGRGTITTCDINTPKELLTDLTTKADIIIVAVGKPNLLTEDMVKEGTIVIDVGINRLENNKIVGDCDFENVSQKCEWITPVPGGVGPMTIAGLISNLYEAWKMKNFIEE
jgi:methylenetetrahydrofolate dehydrogenase (NADP+)/methenyltetrahydrofolate cyclohydrolase